MRTAGTRTTRISNLSPTGTYGTRSDLDPNSNFEDPSDLSDIGGLNADIGGGSQPTPPRRPPMGGIDLGKGLDLEKPKPPRSAIGIEIGGSPQGNLGIGVEVPIGLSPFGARGGVSIDPATGQIRGGYGGLGIGKGPIGASIDIGVDTPPGSDKPGCYKYVTVSLGPFSHTYGKNECEPKSPTPTPGGSSPTPTTPSGTLPFNPNGVETERTCATGKFVLAAVTRDTQSTSILRILELAISLDKKYEIRMADHYGMGSLELALARDDRDAEIFYASSGDRGLPDYEPGLGEKGESRDYYVVVNEGESFYQTGYWCWQPNGASSLSPRQPPNYPVVTIRKTFKQKRYRYCHEVRNDLYQMFRPGCQYDINLQLWDAKPPPACPPTPTPTPTPAPPPPASSPRIPNPPPGKKKMDDKCCKTLMLMMLMQHKHLGVSPIPGMESLSLFAGVAPKGENFKGEQMAFPFEVPKRWLDPLAKKEEKILVKNLSELLFIMGSQSERLERVIGTKEFIKDSEGKLRQSEGNALSWLSGKNPDFAYPDPNDFWLNTDDGIIKEKRLEVRSLTDAIRYVVEMGNRLERILPIAELKNSTIPARWVYPGKKGQLKVGNFIHLVEYMFRADDRARGFWPQTVRIKDSNPAVKGDQKIELKFESQADMLREILKFLIDTEGDGDISNNFALRSAIQQCQMHQLTVQNNAMLDSIVEYMDFKIERTTTMVPMPFSPFAGHEPNLFDKLLTKLGFGNQQIPGSIDKNTEAAVEALFEGVLQNTEVKVPIIKANEKKSMSEALLELLKHVSAASAAVSERVSDGALKRLIESAGIAQAISRFLLKKDIAESNGIGDLDKWINSAESGYADKPETQSLRFPETNPLEPYDRPIAENPRIREIDTKDPKAD